MRGVFSREVKRACVAAAVVCAAAIPSVAFGGPMDTFGSSAWTAGRAGGVVADVEATDAALLNPGRLSDTGKAEISASVVVSGDRLKIDGAASGLGQYVGYRVGAALNIPIGESDDRLYLGLCGHFPQDGIYEIRNAKPDEPRLVGRDETVRHLDVAVSAAVRVWNGLSVGAGVTVGPHASGNVNVDFSSDVMNETDIEVGYRFAPVVGIHWRVADGFDLGLAWRGATNTHYRVFANVVVSDQIGAIHTTVAGLNFGEPDRIVLGAAYDFSSFAPDPLARVRVRVELGFEHYRREVSSVSRVQLLGDDGSVLVDSSRLAFNYSDSWHASASLDWVPLEWFAVMAGYTWQRSPVPVQRGILNILDASHHDVAFGVELSVPQMGERRLAVATAARFSLYQRREMEKTEMLPGKRGYPGITLDGMAYDWHFSILYSF